jgi:hypothetical protein
MQFWGFFRDNIVAGVAAVLGPVVFVGSLVLHTYELGDMGLPVEIWAALGGAIFFLGVLGILYTSWKRSRAKHPQLPFHVEKFCEPQDVRYRHDVGATIGYPHKLLIVLKNRSEKEIIVSPAKWQNATDFPTRRLTVDEQVWSPEGHDGWQLDSWGKETREPFVLPQGRAIQTWIGLIRPLEEVELRRRIITKRLGTLLVPFTVDGVAKSEKIKL